MHENSKWVPNRPPQTHAEGGGRWYEDFAVGDVYRHWPGRTITESDNVSFTLLTLNTHPAHFDKAYAETTEFKQCLVNSTMTLAMVVGMSVRDVSQRAVANLGWKEIHLTAPVFVGDTIYSMSEVVSVRPSASRPGQGIVTVKTTGIKADGSTFLEYERSALVPMRPEEVSR